VDADEEVSEGSEPAEIDTADSEPEVVEVDQLSVALVCANKCRFL
jgi:hypothetical protein